MEAILALSLLAGPVPVLALVLGALGLLVLLRRSVRPWWLLPMSGVVCVLLSFGVGAAAVHLWTWFPQALPDLVLWWLALGLWGAVLAVLRLLATRRRARSGRALLGHLAATVVAAALVVTLSGVQINAYFGQYPTVRSLVSGPPQVLAGLPENAAGHGLSAAQGTPVTQRWSAPAGLPAQGTVRSVNIPGTTSGLVARDALLYLPPAYLSPARPLLPVLVLVGGQPGSPQAWLSSSTLIAELDAFAREHAGLAPIVVMPDPNGSDSANTMCLNSALGQADSYMARDVPAWITSTLDVDTNPAHWAVGGFSYGATCALQMVTRHPERFQSFVAVAPEREPAVAASREETVRLAFHGDTAAFDAVVPLTLLAQQRYPTVQGWLAAGSADPSYLANVAELAAATRAAGIDTSTHSYPGGHSWTVVNAGLPSMLAFLGPRLGLS